MKNNIFKSEALVSGVLIILLVLFLNPFGFFMPPQFLMMLVLILIVIFGIFAGLVWKEKARDERENFHTMLAGRFAFLTGAGVLVIGIVFESLRHSVDPWLIFALIVMILGKIVGIIYGQKKY